MPQHTPDRPQVLAEQAYRLLQKQEWDKAYDAFGKLHDLLHPQLMAVAKRKMRLEEAEDMAEEAIMGLYRQLTTKGCPANVEAWTVDVVTKRVADHYRLRRNTQELLATPPFWDKEANRQKEQTGIGSDPQKLALRNEEQRQINSLLDILPKDMRAVVDAHYYDALPWADVAAQLGVTIDVAKKRAKAALTMMNTMAVKRGFNHEN